MNSTVQELTSELDSQNKKILSLHKELNQSNQNMLKVTVEHSRVVNDFKYQI